MNVPFNRPYLSGAETSYIENAVREGKISGNGTYTKKCHAFFESRYGFKKALLTTSCTDALEMAALLIDLQPGDEVIVPSYTFVSSANAFILRGAKVVFADSCPDHPNLDIEHVAELITAKTKAIVPVHYAGVACDMDPLMELANTHGIYVIEDAAQAIDATYKGKPLGSIGHLAAFSFHETKNIISGEGGLLAINDDRFVERAEIIWEKGTNRAAFWRGEVDKYNWVDIGSSYLPSEVTAAFLLAQLEKLEDIQQKRQAIWEYYALHLKSIEQDLFLLPSIPDYASNNGHMFYLVCKDGNTRDQLIEALKAAEVNAVFHYLSLHQSPFYKKNHGDRVLPNSDCYSDRLVRLPFFYEITPKQQDHVIATIDQFTAMHSHY